MSEKVFVGLLERGVCFQICKGSFDTVKGLVKAKVGFLRRRTFAVPEHYTILPYKKGLFSKRIIFIDAQAGVATQIGDSVVEGKALVLQFVALIDQKFKESIEFLNMTRFWRTVGGRPLDLLETVFYLAAGYGLFRFAEFFLSALFGVI